MNDAHSEKSYLPLGEGDSSPSTSEPSPSCANCGKRIKAGFGTSWYTLCDACYAKIEGIGGK